MNYLNVNKCKICNNNFNNNTYEVPEMMFGMREYFQYFQCSKCGCLQIIDVPNDMNKYYPDNYYSYTLKKENSKTFRNKIKDVLLPLSMNFRMGISKSILGWISNLRYQSTFSWLNTDIGQYYDKSILDVGCGSGSLLRFLKRCGFTKLTGIDPYLKSNVIECGISLLKKNITDLGNDKFDLIMFHHSFEHFENPHQVMNTLKFLLNDEGVLLIRIPLVDSYAWRKYGTSWFALDAPRHYFLYTVKSIVYLIEKYGFYLDNIFYDSTFQQIYYSECYQRNIALHETFNGFSKKIICKLHKYSGFLNDIMDGDQACFYIKKKIN